MTRSASLRALALAAVATAVLAAGCSKKKGFDLPEYPGSSQAGGVPNVEGDAGTLYRMRRMTPDGAQTVARYYREELVAKLGWTEQQGIGPTFTDGNLKVDWNGRGPGEATPLDPTRPGGQVTVYEEDNRTIIKLWQHVPK